MGGFFEYRNLLLALFPECFLSALPHGTEFDVCLVDMMQFLPGLVLSEKLHAGGFNTEVITHKVEKMVAHYQNSEDDPARPLVKTALVVLLDTVHQVPKTKGATQKGRDQGADPHMNEARYEELVALHPGVEAPLLFIESNEQAHRYPLRGSEVWRSTNLKLQLYRLVTCHLLHTVVKRGRALIIDDGLAFSPEVYRAMRAEMIHECRFGERSAFEQECLVSNLITHSRKGITRFILWEGGQFRRWPSTGTGEADIKVLHYINVEGGAHRFLVVNQDTDLIFILLLHMCRLVGPAGDQNPHVELWLDTHSPGNKGENKPYRYIDIKRLYHALVALFAKEYPEVHHPVEMLSFLAFTKRSDFITPFADCLHLQDMDVWNLFSELHASVGEGFLRAENRAMSKVERCREYTWSSSLRGLLKYAVHYDHIKHRFIMGHASIQKFHYLLLQRKVMELRKRLRLPVFSAGLMLGLGREQALEPEELLIYAHDVAERVDAYRRHLSQTEDTMLQTLLKRGPETAESDVSVKKFKLSHLLLKRLSDSGSAVKVVPQVEEAPTDTSEEEEMEEDDEKARLMAKSTNTELSLERYVRQNGDALKPYAKYPHKPFYGVPTITEMRARIYRLELFLDYCRNGWLYGEAMKGLTTQRARLDDRLSVWGYGERLITDEEERRRALNSSYYVTRYSAECPDLFQVVEVVETGKVTHKRYTE
jgi:hypothetical protein